MKTFIHQGGMNKMEYDFTVLRNNAHASIEMFPEKFTKISRKVNEKIESESFGHLEFNTNPTFNDAMVEAFQHCCRGCHCAACFFLESA